MLPKDPVILLSYVNTKLRDRDADLAAFCETEAVSCQELCATLAGIGYEYDSGRNQFV
ncbi:MAG: DUF4250 domain-containing protein [Gemmiger sp.]